MLFLSSLEFVCVSVFMLFHSSLEFVCVFTLFLSSLYFVCVVCVCVCIYAISFFSLFCVCVCIYAISFFSLLCVCVYLFYLFFLFIPFSLNFLSYHLPYYLLPSFHPIFFLHLFPHTISINPSLCPLYLIQLGAETPHSCPIFSHYSTSTQPCGPSRRRCQRVHQSHAQRSIHDHLQGQLQ